MTKKTRKVNPQKTVEPEVFRDSKARNQLGFSNKNYENSSEKPKSKKNRVSKAPINNKKKKPSQRVYSEKELGIPKLNRAIDPEGIKKATRGKKGKVFAESTDSMMKILHDVSAQVDSRNASKLEKARQLEEIREAKRQEIEKKEKEKEQELDKKKKELKKTRAKNKTANSSDGGSKATEKPKKKVAFA